MDLISGRNWNLFFYLECELPLRATKIEKCRVYLWHRRETRCHEDKCANHRFPISNRMTKIFEERTLLSKRWAQWASSLLDESFIRGARQLNVARSYWSCNSIIAFAPANFPSSIPIDQENDTRAGNTNIRRRNFDHPPICERSNSRCLETRPRFAAKLTFSRGIIFPEY